MAKRFKMKFTLLSTSSFQLCRSKDLSSFPGNPVPAIYRLSPVNSKAHHIEDYPSSLQAPPQISPERQKCFHNEAKKPAASKGRKSTSSVPSKRSDDQFPIDNSNTNEQETETLISSMKSFSDDEKVHRFNTMNKKAENNGLVNMNRRKISSSVKKVQRVRFQSTMENRRGAETKSTSMTRSSMEEKVKESFAAVRKSKDPYEDFKKSMVEMIAEMEMSEADELEQLLQCFLALYTQSYHAVIVRAFMEIWQEMFIWNPRSMSKRGIKTDMQK